MAEVSSFWDGITLGDATTAPWSSSEFAEYMRLQIDDHGVSPFNRGHMPVSAFGYGSLLVTGVATPVSIATGYAAISGYTYENTSTATLAIPTPGANPRIDRVVLRVSWAAQTIRIARLAGAEAAIPLPPALTQTIGTTYEVSLAQVYITTGGVITVRDERLGFQGLGPATFFRDIRNRVLEEFFDNFTSQSTGGVAPPGWGSTAGASGINVVTTGVPSSHSISSSATANSSLTLYRGAGGTTQYPTELNQAPLLLEARLAVTSAVDTQTTAYLRLVDAAGTSYIAFGVNGASSASSWVLTQAAGGAGGNFNTGVAIDTSYHIFGIYVPATGGPSVVFIDGVAVGQLSGTIPASTTDMRAEFIVANGTTAAARTMNIDWARLVRGA